MQPRQSDRRIFLLFFYPLFTNISLLFNNFIHDLRQFPQIPLVLVAVLAYLRTSLQILHLIIYLAKCQTNLLTLCRIKCRLKLILVTKRFRHIGQILQRIRKIPPFL